MCLCGNIGLLKRVVNILHLLRQPIRIQLGKILQENLVGNSCRTRRRGKRQFKKGSDWWKFSILNRVMGSQPIRIQLGKILQENLAGKCCGENLAVNLGGKSWGKFLWEISCGKFLWEILWENFVGNLVGNSCRKFLQENLAENLVGKSCREILAGNSCGKILRENLVGKSFLLNSCGKCCGKFPIPISKPFLKVIFKICNSSRSTSFSLVNVKNSFLKPILDRFSHITHQIKA